jgi:hypothetical protein
MPHFDLETFAENGILREQAVREAFDRHDWEQYRDKTVHVRGCGNILVPTWAYLMTAAYLSQVARRITFGEEQAPMPIFVRTDSGRRGYNNPPDEENQRT